MNGSGRRNRTTVVAQKKVDDVREITADMRLGDIDRRFLIQYKATKEPPARQNFFVGCARTSRFDRIEEQFREAFTGFRRRIPQDPKQSAMIWFTCRKCGKTHGRAENSAGTMIFCECGQGNTVPWDSTAVPAATPVVVAAAKVPDLGPIQFDPATAPNTPGATPRRPKTSSYPNDPPPLDDERPYRRSRGEKRDPEFCFNHQRRPQSQACADCAENFCSDCLVKFQGANLCGPCKNFRARRQELPPTASTLASASVVISLIVGPLMMCLLLNKGAEPMRVVAWLSLRPQVMALGLGVWALREAEVERKGGGQWVAITGVATAALTCVLIVLMNPVRRRIAAALRSWLYWFVTMIECPFCYRVFRQPPEKIGARCPKCKMPLYEDPTKKKKDPERDYGKCVQHPDAPTVAKCSRCDAPVCKACRTRWHQEVVCPQCVDLSLIEDEPSPQEAQLQTKQAWFAVDLRGQRLDVPALDAVAHTRPSINCSVSRPSRF